MSMNVQQKKAIAEISMKSLKAIQIETAYTWAYRAWAAYKLSCEGSNLVADAIEYEHEAIEHAALANDDQVLADVRLIIADARQTL